MIRLIEEANRIREKQGWKKFFIRACGFAYRMSIRRILPVSGNAVWNDVELPKEATHPRRVGDEYLPTPFHYSIRPHAEGGETRAHRKLTKKGDHVVIIGGGRGVSSVVAARQVGSTGSVTVFEGSEKYANIVRKTCRLNNVSRRCKIRRETVGPNKEVYGDSDEFIKPSELPNCDVLELDCEGAEKEIINQLEIRPRILIIEMHPINFEEHPVDLVLTTIESKGYQVDSLTTNKGDIVNREEFINLLNHNRYKKGEAPVAVMIKN